MSGFDIAAGVVGIASLGITVAKGLIDIADSIGSAGEEVRLCAAETTLFSRMLNDLSSALLKPTAASRATQNTTEDLIDICERILKPFKSLVARLSPLLKSYRTSEHQLRQLSLRIQWYFRHKSKVTFYQQALGRLKLTLTCLLASMNYQEARVNAPQMIFFCQAEVRTSKASIERRQRLDRAAPLEPALEVNIDGQLLLNDVVSDQGAELQDPVVQEVEQDMNHLIINGSGSSTEEIPNIDNDIDADPSSETATAVHDDLLCLQRKVLRIAETALKPSDTSNLAIALPTSASNPQGMPERSIGQTTDKPIILHDPSGKKFALPFSQCRTWDSTKDKMQEIYVQYPRLKDIIARGDYALLLDKDVWISPEDWESIITPGMSVTFRPTN